jgi:DNA-binding PadR family transcriptional regulator
MLDYLILNMLTKKPLWGYEIIKKIRREFGVYLGASVVYPLLNEMERMGYVESCYRIDRIPRKVYTITEKGLRRLDKQRRDIQSFVFDKDTKLVLAMLIEQ